MNTTAMTVGLQPFDDTVDIEGRALPARVIVAGPARIGALKSNLIRSQTVVQRKRKRTGLSHEDQAKVHKRLHEQAHEDDCNSDDCEEKDEFKAESAKLAAELTSDPKARQEHARRTEEFWAARRERRSNAVPEREHSITDMQVSDTWSSLMGKLRKAHDSEVKGLEEARLVSSRIDLARDVLRDRMSQGDHRLSAIRKMLNNMGVVRSHFQNLFHNYFIRATLEIIYGDEWTSCMERVLADLDIKCVRPEVCIMTARRFGKTVSVALYVLAMLLVCPGIKICIFSTGKRASGTLMTEIMDRMTFIEGAASRVTKNNQENLFVAGKPVPANATKEERAQINNGKDVSRMYSFPASVAGTQHNSPHLFKH